MIIHLIRHAATVIDRHKSAPQWDLAPDAFEACHKLKPFQPWSQLNHIVSSGEMKAVETARCIREIAGKAALELDIYPGLNEVSRGDFVEDYLQCVSDFFNYPQQRVPGWETAEFALTRATLTFADIVSKEAVDHLAIVGHGLIFSLLRAHWLGQDKVNVADWQAIKMPDVSTWEWKEEQMHLLSDFGN